ncbi:MAG: PH domain-containing protein [Clostridia bacterium]|nr:PH domain-containing protein [Clostridia bacterium]
MHERSFKYEFSKLIKWLIIIGIIVCVAGFILVIVQVYRTIANNINPTTYEFIGQLIMFFVTLFLAILLVWLLRSSCYIVDKENLITKFGFIKSKFNLSDIEAICLNRNTNKLTLQFNNGNYMNIVIDSFWHEEFVDVVTQANKNIRYIIESKEGPVKKDDSDKSE